MLVKILLLPILTYCDSIFYGNLDSTSIRRIDNQGIQRLFTRYTFGIKRLNLPNIVQVILFFPDMFPFSKCYFSVNIQVERLKHFRWHIRIAII